MNIKAYKVWDPDNIENAATIVFAENAQSARKIAMGTDACEDSPYICIRANRVPEMDSHYRGQKVIDWYNEADRWAMVSLGWACSEMSDECDRCTAKEICWKWDDINDEID